MKFHNIFLLLASLLFSSCNPKPISKKYTDSKDEYVITNVSVLPMTSEVVLNNQDVHIRDGKIIKIGKVTPSKYATKIDGTGKFLMPGLTEMHAHIPVPRDGDDRLVMETLFLYLSQGVTNIRGMLGDPYHLGLREKAANGEILSPRIYTSSPSVNGRSTPTPEVAKDKITRYQKEGYDFLKIHPGLTLETWDAIEATAKEVGIGYSGHVPTAVGIHRALEAKYKTIDHLDGYLEGLVPTSENVDPNANGFFGYDFTNLMDEKLIDELVEKTLSNGVAVVPTQTLFTRWFSPTPTEELVNAPEMQYMGPGTRLAWLQSHQALANPETFSKEQWERFVGLRKKLMKAMDKAGVTFLLGSDAPQVFNVPGFSIHHEMKDMADAGLSNFKILQSGTTNPADFFGATGEYGVIKEGAAADLILVKGNPLEDLSNAQRIEGVMVGKEWLTEGFIIQKLEEIAVKYRD